MSGSPEAAARASDGPMDDPQGQEGLRSDI